MRKIKTRQELIKLFIDFFKGKNHKEVPNVSLVPEHDPTVLFTTAGMHPLVPFLLSEKHPLGKRLVNVQKCIRTGDIDSVGDSYHHTFFEMLGNWSLGDYFKKGAIEFSFEFLTKVLEIPIEKLAVSCFAGDKDAEKDNEAEEIWKNLGIQRERIAFLGKEQNWWGPAGKTGPCGPDTEMFYWKGKDKPQKIFSAEDENWIEIWNDVFMQYNKTEDKYEELKQKNVDTGLGVERVLAVLDNLDDNYLTSCFLPIIKKIEALSKKAYEKEDDKRAMRIIADHIKASCFIIADGILPSNIERGYVLRRLIRRAVRYGRFLGIQNFTKDIAREVFPVYMDYNHLQKNKEKVLNELEKEESKFSEVLDDGIKRAEKIFSRKKPISEKKFAELMKNPDKATLMGRIFQMKRERRDYSLKQPKLSKEEIDKATITGHEAFLLYQSYGFPLEMIDEFAMAKGLLLSHSDFRDEQKKHEELSRTATEGRFKSGLADYGRQATRYHTATHLLLAALKQVLGKNIEQRGSNITAERLRFDFSFDRKLTEQELREVERIVNGNIEKSLKIEREEMSLEQAKKSGATGIFHDKYKEKVSVYTICDKKETISKEICAGPHVSNTNQLGRFKIIKEEASSQGVRRIKAVIE